MHAADPAAGPAFALLDLGDRAPDVILARRGLLDGNIPANPLIPGERCEPFPNSRHSRHGTDGFCEICGQLVNCAAREWLVCHSVSLLHRC